MTKFIRYPSNFWGIDLTYWQSRPIPTEMTTFATTDPETAMITTVGVVDEPEGDSPPSPPD